MPATTARESDDNATRSSRRADTVTKAATVIDDPFGTPAPNAKAIPGAIVEYTITITNNGAAARDSVDSDGHASPAQRDYVAGHAAARRA